MSHPPCTITWFDFTLDFFKKKFSHTKKLNVRLSMQLRNLSLPFVGSGTSIIVDSYFCSSKSTNTSFYYPPLTRIQNRGLNLIIVFYYTTDLVECAESKATTTSSSSSGSSAPQQLPRTLHCILQSYSYCR